MKQPVILDSARKHGVTDNTILHAFNNPILVEDLDEGFTMFIGPDDAGTSTRSGLSDRRRVQSWFMRCELDPST